VKEINERKSRVINKEVHWKMMKGRGTDNLEREQKELSSGT
jgi:hypothetical protein